MPQLTAGLSQCERSCQSKCVKARLAEAVAGRLKN